MSVIKKIILLPLLLSFAGCVSAVDVRGKSSTREELPSSYALQGTNTAVVGIAIDPKGIPLETVKEVVLLPGQKAIFAAPDKFQIKFKKEMSPSGQIYFESRGGVITIAVPKDIFEKPEYKNEKYIRFDYSIFVNGRELDPPFIIKRDD